MSCAVRAREGDTLCYGRERAGGSYHRKERSDPTISDPFPLGLDGVGRCGAGRQSLGPIKNSLSPASILCVFFIGAVCVTWMGGKQIAEPFGGR